MKKIMAFGIAIWVVIIRPIVLSSACILGCVITFFVITGTVVVWKCVADGDFECARFFWTESLLTKGLLVGAVVGTTIVGTMGVAFLVLIAKPEILWLGRKFSQIKGEYERRIE